MRAIEIGCGFGDTTLQILGADPRIQVQFNDKNPDRIQFTEDRLRRTGINPNRYFIAIGDALEVLHGTDTTSVDVIATAQTIHNFPNKGEGSKREYYEEIARVLVPGGLFVNADKYVRTSFEGYREDLSGRMAEFADYALHHDPHGPDPLKKFGIYMLGFGLPEEQERVIAQKAKNIQALARWFNHLMLDCEPHRLMNEETTRQELEEAGFVDIKTPWRKETAAVITALKGGN